MQEENFKIWLKYGLRGHRENFCEATPERSKKIGRGTEFFLPAPNAGNRIANNNRNLGSGGRQKEIFL